jgi:hypothetical protein
MQFDFCFEKGYSISLRQRWKINGLLSEFFLTIYHGGLFDHIVSFLLYCYLFYHIAHIVHIGAALGRFGIGIQNNRLCGLGALCVEKEQYADSQ